MVNLRFQESFWSGAMCNRDSLLKKKKLVIFCNSSFGFHSKTQRSSRTERAQVLCQTLPGWSPNAAGSLWHVSINQCTGSDLWLPCINPAPESLRQFWGMLELDSRLCTLCTPLSPMLTLQSETEHMKTALSAAAKIMFAYIKWFSLLLLWNEELKGSFRKTFKGGDWIPFSPASTVKKRVDALIVYTN